MGLVARLLGRETRNDEEHGVSRLQAFTRDGTRRELISMAVRDTLKKHDLPPECLLAEALPSILPGRLRGLHIQLVFRDWQPSLLAYVVALESAVMSRLRRLDPLSPSWVSGVSWRFEPNDRTVWPQLPIPASSGAARAALARGADRARAPADIQVSLQSGDPASTPAPPGHAPVERDFSPTLPMDREQ